MLIKSLIMNKKGLIYFTVGYLDALWFIAFGILDKTEYINKTWLACSSAVMTITHLVGGIILCVSWATSVESENKNKDSECPKNT